MKKAILLIAALLVLSTMAFADSSMGIWGRTQFNLAQTNVNLSGPATAWGPNWGGNGPRMGLGFDFTNKSIEFHIKGYYNGAITIDKNIATTGQVLDMVNMYGVVKFIPDLFSVNVGRMDGDGFDMFRVTSPNPNSDMHNNNIGRLSGWGLILVLAPKDLGLQVAVQLRTPAPNGAQYLWQNELLNINACAGYTIPNIVKISAGFLENTGFVYDGTQASQYQIFARAQLLAVSNLTLWVDDRISNFENTNAQTLGNEVNLGFGYTMGALGIFLGANLTMPALATSAVSYMTFGANLEVTYDLGPITVGLIGTFSGSTATGASMSLGAQPYVQFDDFSVRIASEWGFTFPSTGSAAITWQLPVYFTFGF